MKRILSAAVLLLVAFCAAAQGNRAVVNLSCNYMREAPDYTAELGNQNLMGTVVEILDSQSYWRKVKSPEPYTAWVNEMGLTPMTDEEAEDYLASEKYIFTADYGHVYSLPDLKSERVSDLVMGDLLRQAAGKGTRRRGFSKVILPGGAEGWVQTRSLADFGHWAATCVPTGEDVVAVAMSLLGSPYLWGGNSVKGVDCSGLVWLSYYMNGLLLPRNTSQQCRLGIEIEPVEKALQIGDLLFFGTPAQGEQKERISHVGIYISDDRYIHSSQLVRISSIDPADKDYAGRKPLRARRVLGHTDEGWQAVRITDSPHYFLANTKSSSSQRETSGVSDSNTK